MENANSPDYLHKIRSTVIENIRRTGKPSVEALANIPDNPIMKDRGMDSEDEDEADDLDEDENPDRRVTQRQRDKQTEVEGEMYDESDDEEYKNNLGVRAQPGVKKRRNITDFQNPNAARQDDIDALDGDDMNEESAASTRQPSVAIKSRTTTPAAAEHAANEDGDVDMDEPEAPVAAPTSTRSQSPAGVVTPPESPPTAAATAPSMAPTSAPAGADVEMEGADEETKEEVSAAKEEGDAERDTENVKGEVRTEVAKD